MRTSLPFVPRPTVVIPVALLVVAGACRGEECWLSEARIAIRILEPYDASTQYEYLDWLATPPEWSCGANDLLDGDLVFDVHRGRVPNETNPGDCMLDADVAGVDATVDWTPSFLPTMGDVQNYLLTATVVATGNAQLPNGCTGEYVLYLISYDVTLPDGTVDVTRVPAPGEAPSWVLGRYFAPDVPCPSLPALACVDSWAVYATSVEPL